MTNVRVKPISELEVKSEVSASDKILILDSDTDEARLADKAELKGDKGDPGDPGTPGAAATIIVGTTTTGAAGTSASVTNSGTSSAAVLNFTIPKGDKGDTGAKGADGTDGVDGQDGADGNGIASITSSKAGKVTTVTITETNGDSESFQISDGADGEGSGDVIGPSSSANGDIVLFDGTTGKLIKDSGKTLSDLGSSWGNITGTLSDQTDLNTALSGKQASLTAGKGITLSSNTISTNIIYATTDTAFNTQDKECTTALGNYTPVVGDVICIRFTQGCGVGSPRFSFDGGNQKISCTVGIDGANAATLWLGMSLVAWLFVYDGSTLRTFPVKNTTYSGSTGISISGTTITNTGVTSVNSNTGAVIVNDVKTGSTAPTAAEGVVWYDTTNDVLKVYDGTSWNTVGAGTGDVVGPSSSVDGHLAVFDGATGKLLKDGGAIPSGIENVTTGTTTTVTGIWAGTEAEYGDITTPSASVLYFTF